MEVFVSLNLHCTVLLYTLCIKKIYKQRDNVNVLISTLGNNIINKVYSFEHKGNINYFHIVVLYFSSSIEVSYSLSICRGP